MTKYTPPSIKDVGLHKYLDDHAASHRGLGFEMFVILHCEAELNITNLARAFNVSRGTIKKYIGIYEDEIANIS